MQGWHYGKGLIHYRPIFRQTKLAFLMAELYREKKYKKQNAVSTSIEQLWDVARTMLA